MLNFLASALRAAAAPAARAGAKSAVRRAAVSRPALKNAPRTGSRAAVRSPLPTRARTKSLAPSPLPAKPPPLPPQPPPLPAQPPPIPPRGPSNSHPGTEKPVDASVIEKHYHSHTDRILSPIEPNHPTRDWAMTASNLTNASANLRASGSSFIPSASWSGSIEATGYADVPIRNVLHYCLAVVFGMQHRSGYYHLQLHATLFPNENRVTVNYVLETSLILEVANIVAQLTLDTSKNVLSKVSEYPDSVVSRFKRGFGQAREVVSGIFDAGANVAANGGIGAIGNVLENQGAQAAAGIANQVLKHLGDLNRRIGPAGLWDMGKTDYYAGRPPLSLTVLGVQPFTDMELASSAEKSPMLTRRPALNPQGPTTPEMDFPTHVDLRSLVAQALYDPGVLPPKPDTFAALPNGAL